MQQRMAHEEALQVLLLFSLFQEALLAPPAPLDPSVAAIRR